MSNEQEIRGDEHVGKDTENHEEGEEKDPDDEDEAPELPAACNYCTFAVTGATTSFQPIFVCHECFNENSGDRNVPLCICQACADLCHDSNDHDVEYIGMGASI